MADGAGGSQVAACVEELAAQLVLVDASDIKGLADLHTALEGFTAAAEGVCAPEVLAAASAAASLVEAIVLGDVDDAVASFAIVAQGITALQGVVRDGHTLAEAGWPAELAQTGAAAATTPAAASRPLTEAEQAVAVRLEELAALQVLVDVNDLKSLADLHTSLENVCSAAEDTAPAEVLAAARAAASLVEDIVLDDVEDDEASFAVVTRAVVALQAVLRDGRSVADAGFPDELGVETGGAVAPAAPAAEALPPAKPIEGDPALVAEFISEAREHLEAADIHLLQLETEPSDQDALDAVFRAFHTIKGVSGFLSLTQIGQVAHEAENLLDQARKGTVTLEGRCIDVAFEACDMLKRLVELVNEALTSGGLLNMDSGVPRLLGRLRTVLVGQPGDRLGEILVGAGLVAEESVNEAIEHRPETGPAPRLGEQLVKEQHADASDVALALQVQRGPTTRQALAKVAEAVKVDADRLDRILDTIGELVIAQSMVSQADEMRAMASPTLNSRMNQVDKITRELQALGTSLRMVPVKATFQKMARLARDVAKKASKQIEFQTVGDDTELDKNVVDQIGDPLVHMIRNAVDHGLEASGDDRRAAGKSEVGHVTLRAFHKGGNIHIEVEDDGRGLDREAIVAKALQRGLIRTGDNLSEREIFNLIFEPGFSTAKQITDVSGRGVGMDVVRRNIEALRGQIEIRSEKGHGSVFSMRLPLTLAIIDGMVIRLGAQRYILPTLSIVTTVRPTTETLSTVIGQGELLQVQGTWLPLHRLAELFGIEQATAEATDALAVVVEEDGRKAAFLADELLGQQQIVIKSLGEALQGVPGLAGGAVMPDGRVGLIVDVAGLLRLAEGDGERARPGHAEQLVADQV